jgi:hypothetical protein
MRGVRQCESERCAARLDCKGMVETVDSDQLGTGFAVLNVLSRVGSEYRITRGLCHFGVGCRGLLSSFRCIRWVCVCVSAHSSMMQQQPRCVPATN